MSKLRESSSPMNFTRRRRANTYSLFRSNVHDGNAADLVATGDRIDQWRAAAPARQETWMNVDNSSEPERTSNRIGTKRSVTHSGKASIRRFGSSWPNDAKIPMSNDRERNGSNFGHRCVFNCSFSARFCTMFDDECVVITSRSRMTEECFVFHTW